MNDITLDDLILGVAETQLHKPDVRALIWDKTGGKCWYCGVQTNPWRDFSIDHFLPRSAGGPHDYDNLVPACRSCNSRKRHRDPEALRLQLAQESCTVRFTTDQIVYLAEQGIALPIPNYQFYFEREGLGG